MQWGIIGTDYNNWYVLYFCGNFMGAQMTWLSVYGKQLEISEQHMDEAKAAIAAKIPGGYAMGWPWTKKSAQGEFFGGECKYDWGWKEFDYE